MPLDKRGRAIFYLITGLHGAHVCIGLMINGFTQLRAWLSVTSLHIGSPSDTHRYVILGSMKY